MGLASCDYLEIEPVGQVIPHKVSEFRALLTDGYYNYALNNIRLYTGLLSDEVGRFDTSEFYETSYAVALPYNYTWQYNSQMQELAYRECYRSIFYANSVIDSAADADNDYGDILKVILFTGLREAEALGLTWDCIDFKKGTLKICKQLQKRPAEAGGFQFAALKNDKTRILRPAPFVMDMLRAVRSKQAQRRLQAGDLWQDWIDPAKQYAACRLVFTNALGDHLHPQRLYAHHKKIAAKAGAPDARVHDLRHTFAVLSLQNGDDVKTVQENLGHATAAFTLDVYGHVSERMKEDSAARMQGYFENLKKARKKLRRSHHRRSCFCPR